MADERATALLEQLVELQKVANERQQQAIALAERNHAQARERGDRALEMLRTAVARQRVVVRVWLGMFVFVLAVIVGLLVVLSRLLP
jgi:t-SNARE complex subunit (syntaxin)